ncbi:MAG: T9SS type A sorting domain-containing protein [Bacteroidota bacterium]
MKNFSVCIILLLFLSPIYSQRPYVKMLHEDAHWLELNVYGQLLETTLKGDTVINGLTYKKVWCREAEVFFDQVDSLNKYLLTSEPQLEAFVREDSVSRKVYAIFLYDMNDGWSYIQHLYCQKGVEYVWYDFSLEIGDSIAYGNWRTDPQRDTISSIALDSVFRVLGLNYRIGTSPHWRYDVGGIFKNTPYSYFEGVGGTTGFLLHKIDEIGTDVLPRLVAYWRDSVGDKLYSLYEPDTTKYPLRPYLPLLHEDAHWIVYRDNGNFSTSYETTIGGDTIVNGLTYKKLFNQILLPRDGNQSNPTAPFYRVGKRELEALIREDTASRKVYAISFINGPSSFNGNSCDLNQEALIYDFSVQVLDSFSLCNGLTAWNYGATFRNAGMVTSKLSSIKGLDSLFFFFYAKGGVSFHAEGIGSPYGLFGPVAFQEATPFSGGYHELLYYCRESLGCADYWLASNESPGNILLNWTVTQDRATQTLHIRFANKLPDEVVLFDLSGKEVMRKAVNRQAKIDVSIEQLPVGIYVLGAELKGQVVARQKVVK